MTSISSKPTFMSGLHYIDHQQYNGKEYGGMRMLNRRFQFSKNLYNKDLFAHYGCVNAIEFSNNGEWLVSGGDDKRVLLWNIDKTLSGCPQPKSMKGEHNSNIFCLGFSNTHSKLFSAGNDEQVILHDVNTGEITDVFLHDEAVYGLSVDPVNESIFASACDDGRILIWDTRLASNEPFTLASCTSAYHAVMYNPVEPRFLATANAKDGVCLWDIRKPKMHVMKYGPTLLSQSAMSVRFNSVGTHLLALRRRFPPVLYEITSTQPAAEFDHQEYYNSCTMKSCCFAGERDQYVLSGSDDFKLYVWKIPDSANTKKGVWVSKAHFVLRGHRSIVNQVRYNNTYGILASSGVEKIIKLWSSFPLSYREDTDNYVSSKDNLRKVYSHEEYITLVLESGQFMTHDYSHHSVQEDPRMMAFFDSLVQRDIEGWTSDSSNATETMNTSYVVESSDSSTSSSSDSSSSDDPIIPPDLEIIQGPVPRRPAQFVTIEGRMTPRDPVLRHTRQPHVAMSLAYVTKRALDNQLPGGSSSTPDETPDPSLDRISMLIAQKRREQMLKTTRAAMKLDKNIGKMVKKNVEQMKKRKSCPQASGNDTSDNNNSANGRRGTKQSNPAPLTDKRKLLRKKRAKLNKESLMAQKSSDSEDSCEQESSGLSKNIRTKNEVESSDDNEDAVASSGALRITEDCPTVTLPPEVARRYTYYPADEEPNSTNGNGTSRNPIPVHSYIYLPVKSGKHNNRNYRKRSAEDKDD